MIKGIAKNSLPITVVMVVVLSSICCKTQTAVSKAPASEQPTPGAATFQGNKLEKVGERPARDVSGCFMRLHFADESVGWMSCLGYLWRTTDGGRNWQEIYYAGNNRLPDYYFVNSNLVWAQTLEDMQKSEDEGLTWKAMPSPIAGDKATLDDIQFLKDGRRGWLAASNYISCPPEARDKLGVHSRSLDGKKCLKAYIFYTEDGGETWRKQIFDSTFGGSISIRITPDDRIWAFHNLHVFYFANGQWTKVEYTKGQCTHKTLLETIDFYQQTLEPSAPVEIFFFGDIGWLSFSNGYLAKSTDGGRTWCDHFDLKSLTNNSRFHFRKLYFSDANNGWGLADGIYETKDGGATWKRMETNVEFEDMYFLDANHSWAISKEGLFRIKH